MKRKCFSLLLIALAGVVSAQVHIDDDNTTVSLPVERRMLFNRWTDGEDYGEYYGGWTHEGGAPNNSGSAPVFQIPFRRSWLLPGTNHFHTSGWRVYSGSVGSSSYLSQSTKNYIAPQEYNNASIGLTTNWQASLHNTLGARIESPVYAEGIGTIYFDAVNNSTASGTLSIQIATNMVHRTILDTYGPLLAQESSTWAYNWFEIDTMTLSRALDATQTEWDRYQKSLDLFQPVCFKIVRTTVDTSVTENYTDVAFLAVDNICVSYPRHSVRVQSGEISKVPGLLSQANVNCRVSNADFDTSSSALLYSSHEMRTVRIFYKSSIVSAYSSQLLTYSPGTGDGSGNNENYEGVIEFPAETTAVDYYYECSVTGGRYFPTDYTQTGVTYWTDGGEPVITMQSVVSSKDVSKWSIPKSTSELDTNRLMLFNKWTDGTDYGDYFGGQWKHEGGAPSDVAPIASLPTFFRRFLLNGSNHFHNVGWQVIDAKTGSSAWMRNPNANYIGPQQYVPGLTNYQANLNNTLNARVESPCYSDGIGTIYFDAVNVLTQGGEIQLQIATNMFDWVTRNAYTNYISDLDELVVSNETGDIAHIFSNNWTTVCSTNLNMAQNSVHNSEGFVRFQHTLNYHEPIRFRICRSSVITSNDVASGFSAYPDAYFLAIDNIQVSSPPSDVKIEQEPLSFDPGYPTPGQRLTIRCRVSNVDTNVPTAWEDRNVQVVYRWRYLDQSIGAWTTSTMEYVPGAEGDDGAGNGELYTGAIPEQERVGDLEYYFVCNFDGFRFIPVDYTGLGHTYWPNSSEHSESLSPRLLRNTELGGEREFFVRLRRYASDIGDMQIGTTIQDEPFHMELIGDNVWRAYLPLRSLDDGTFECWMFTTNTYVAVTNADGFFDHQLDTTYRCWAELAQSTSVTAYAPTGGSCQETDHEHRMKFRVTGGAYAAVTLDLNLMEYKVCRAEYQNFNDWQSYTNFFATTYAQPDATAFKENFDSWNKSEDDLHNAYFKFPAVMPNTYRLEFETEDLIKAYNATYVSEIVRADEANNPYWTATTQSRDSFGNVALRLIGGDMLTSSMNTNGITSFGYLTTAKDSLMDGLKSISFKARVNTPLTPEQMVQYIGSSMPTTGGTIPKNYSFSSKATITGESEEEFSVSLLGYITSDNSFYEFRVTQTRPVSATAALTTKQCRIALYRWNNGTPTILTQSSGVLSGTLKSLASSRTLVLSLFTAGESVYIRGGFGTDALYFTDSTSQKLTNGNVGVLIANCEGNFGQLDIGLIRSWDDPKTSPAVENTRRLIADSASANYNWRWPSSRYNIANQTITSLTPSQRLYLYVQPVNNYEYRTDPTDHGWELAQTFTVGSYSYKDFSYSPQTATSYHVKLQNGGSADIAIDAIVSRSWHGKTQTGGNDEWSMYEGWVTNDTVTARGRVVELDTSRSKSSSEQYIQSPALENGHGQLSFDYKIVSGSSHLTVQEKSLYGSTWHDVSTWTETSATGWKHITAYLGNTNGGYFRVLNERVGNTEGIVRFDNMTAWDYPQPSNTSWKTYNGLATDTDRDRIALDESKMLFLNNSTTRDVNADISPMDVFDPYLKTPLLLNGVGEIRLEARKYNATDADTSIDVWGMTDEDWNTDTTNWVYLESLTITNVNSQYYTVYSKTSSELEDFDGEKYKAIRFQMSKDGDKPRVCLENVAVCEPIYPGFDINDVKLLRHNNRGEYEVCEQPLVSDLIGIEARLTNLRMSPSNINVFVSYHVGTNTWGIANLWGEPNRSNWRSLQPTTLRMYPDPDDPQLFRTSIENDIPFQEENAIVQFCVWALYSDAQNVNSYFQVQKKDSFTNPSWYYPIDLNERYEGWSPYFIVYRIPLGTVFVNEINSYENRNSYVNAQANMNPYVELAIPADMDLRNWTINIESERSVTKALDITMEGKEEVTNGYAFFLIASRGREYSPALTNVDMYITDFLNYLNGDYGGVRVKRPLGMYEDTVAYAYEDLDGVDFAALDPEGKLVYVGADIPNASLSVTNCVDSTTRDWCTLVLEGDESDYIEKKRAFPVGTQVWTPGAPNLMQILPQVPEIYAGLSNVVVTAVISPSDYGLQNGTTRKLSFKLPKGTGATNIVYDTRNWYRITSLTAAHPDSQTSESLLNSAYFTQNSTTNFTLVITNVQEATDITARISRDPTLNSYGLPPTALNWLMSFPDNQIRYDSWCVPENRTLSFMELYWLNCDPTNRYVFDGGFTGKVERAMGGTNIFLTAWMSLACNDGEPKNVTALRGNIDLDRPTFKIKGKHKLTDPEWITARQYTFDENSWDSNHACRILIDNYPFADGIPHLREWKDSAFFKWQLEYDEQRAMSIRLLTNCPAPAVW
ncbi:MAG: hypothetical protein IKR48_11905 [Kiritimatiellae bacterium]|nr:hypothetical protein [Kiritimatiellia bacterium]